MASPLLKCPNHWIHATLEPNKELGLIIQADSGSTPSTTNSEFWDGEIPWLTPKEITLLADGVYVTRTERTITQDGLAKLDFIHYAA